MKVQLVGTKLSPKFKALAKKIPSLVQDTMEALTADALKDYESTVATWNNKPEFIVKRQSKNIWTITTDDEIYAMLDSGTRPHKIEAKPGHVLAFQNKYVAKTSPRVIASTSGGPSGKTVFAMSVDHPGTKARYFNKTIAAKYTPTKVAKEMQTALKGGLEAVGL